MKFLVVLISLGLLTGCTDEKVRISATTIDELSSYRTELPSPDIALVLFVKSAGNQLCKLNIVGLHEIYLQGYSKKMSFKQFVEVSLNQTLNIDNELLRNKNAFVVNKDVANDFETLSIDQFERKYCEMDAARPEHLFIRSKNYKGLKLISICYFLFISNYKIVSDDYSGTYVAIKS